MSISPGVPVRRGGEESFKEEKDQTIEDLGHLVLGQRLWMEDNGIECRKNEEGWEYDQREESHLLVGKFKPQE